MTKAVCLEKNKNQLNFIFTKNTYEISVKSANLNLNKHFEELNNLIGLAHVKKFVEEIYAWLEINKIRQEQGLYNNQQVLHMIFKGNPGTGKTTVARIIGNIFKEMGFLSKGHLVEVERADLVGEYIGHTAQKTREHVKKALGGILFIDEAYSLSRGGEKDFGREAIDTLVKAMEDYKNDFILILAGYSKEMDQFLTSNPGLPSRFPIFLNFEDFTQEQLMAIAEQILKQRQYIFSIDAKEKLRKHIQQKIYYKKIQKDSFGNARYIRNIIERAIRYQAVRLINKKKINKEDLITIKSQDLQFKDEKFLWSKQ